ncbi:ribose ABC transporter substrate-binding protein RbsB [Paenibacillus phoenicis]|uniref:Ribose ABC transporter substrate-binding protein RbsB n=1 Tax=Paenibacillus phoenicis TaxID=554117 RepID=A0ABU5PNZ5_9BACL|nr:MULTISPECIES: ribose ABC transporter substrate-binding protein RbsB [Paenibacillus]EES74462.1 D-ribose-binding periplasmic protein [Paenibacillus sp. oral taxon 786 str. D14]MCT2194757.1 ribose ABC transporter substrate-binding protein RbsB [Paenibacillus sp. p3-SID1389]MEA3571663.1 ribose ABC transporter substrate-binding protein RbsB [Paenibacillus phoenicis]MEC2345359.1 ribose ABC transporter substrate-binding protein RbsB [Paenibacillus barengoltzii]
MKKYGIVWPLTLALFLLLAACTTGNEGGTAGNAGNAAGKGDNGGKVKIGLSISTQNNPFFVTLKEGAEKAAQAAGAELIVVDAQDDTSKQISGIEDLIQQQVDVILINPTDSDAVVTAVESANNANIPVITVDRAANGGTVVSHIASDNVAGGKMAGEFILEKLGGKGNIVELQGIAGTSAARDRGEGFHSAVDGKDGVKVVASQPADFDRAKGLTVMENILQSNSDVQAVFAHNDEMALGALQAIEAAGKKDIIVVGFDATDDAVSAVNSGTMAATVAQKPELIGQKAIETAMKVAAGEQVESSIPVELELVTKQ